MPDIYLDNAATTRPYPEVVEAVTRAMTDGFGNASSLHRRGLAAMRLIEDARAAVLALVGGGPWRVIFTSSGSEADTLAVLSALRGKRDALHASALDHAAVTESCRAAGERGAVFREMAVTEGGGLDHAAVSAPLDERTALVCLSHVAAELGTVQDVSALARIVKARAPKARVHVDAVQAAAQLPRLDYPAQVDSVALSAHKLHGPLGVGALLVRPNLSVRPLLHGGDQEDGLRPGTYNTPGIAGFAVAARLWEQQRLEATIRMQRLCDDLVESATSRISGVRLLGDPRRRAPGMAVLAVGGVRSEVLLHALEARGVLAASSSACHSRRKEPPPSLVAAGLRPDEGALRLSLDSHTSETDISTAVESLAQAVAAVRQSGVHRP